VRAALKGGDTACIRLAFALLALDAAAFGIRWYAMRWDASLGNPSHPVLFRARRRVMMVRLVDVNLLPGLFLLAQAPIPAAGFLVIGILLDRYAFYALSLRQTTEAEVDRVNDHLCKKSENP
jgi:hypothetical protein